MSDPSFSIDPSLVQPALTKLQKNLEDLDERLQGIYRQAMVKDVPLVQSIVMNLQPTPSDCVMLSKVFARLAELLATQGELTEQVSLLKGITSRSDWLYEMVGDTGRDVDTLLKDILTPPSVESENS